MAENESPPLPHFQSLQELMGFFDTHDMGEYWDSMREAYFEVDAKTRQCLVAIEEDLMSQLAEMAKSRQVSLEVLIDAWLRERAAGAKG